MGAIVEGAGDIIGGNYQASADTERATELEQQASLQTSQGEDAAAQRISELNQTVGAIKALAGSRGINPNSTSIDAYTRANRAAANTDASNIALNSSIAAGLDREGAQGAKIAGQGAQIGSFFQAAGAIDSAATKAFEAFG